MKRIKVGTFGANRISFMDVPITEVTKAVEVSKRANTRKYIVKTNGQGAVEFAYESDDHFAISLYNNGRWVTNIQIETGTVKVGNATARGTQVSTAQTLVNEPRNVHTIFKIDQREQKLLKRIDVKSEDTTWFSIFSHATNVLMVRPNGNWLQEKFVYLTDQLITQAINNYRRTEGQSVLPMKDTMVMQRRQLKKDEEDMTKRKHELQEEKDLLDRETKELAQQKQTLREEKQALGRKVSELDRLTNKFQEAKENFERETAKMEEMKRDLNATRERLKEEAAEIQVMAERSAQVKAQYVHFRTEREKVVQEVAQINKAKTELASCQRELQESKDALMREVELADSIRTELPPLVHSVPWSRVKYTEATLDDRFTNSLRVVMTDGKMTVTKNPTQ